MQSLWRTRALALAVIVVAYSVHGLGAQAGDPLIGTWQLNREASTFTPGAAPQRLTRTFEERDDGAIVATTKGVDATSRPVEVRVAFRRDGQPYPIESAGTTSDRTITFELLSRDPFTVEYRTMGGVASTVGTETVSPDGMTYTVQIVGTNRDGARVDIVQVWEKR